SSCSHEGKPMNVNASKMRVAVLYDTWEEEPEPAPAEKPARQKAKKKKKEKHDREEIFEALGKLGYEPFYHALDGKNQSLTALARVEADLIFKPTSEDGSIGIDASSVVDSVKELMEKIHYIHEEFDAPALIEEYIEGREIYASVLGNENAEVLPLVELDLSKLPEGTPRIA